VNVQGGLESKPPSFINLQLHHTLNTSLHFVTWRNNSIQKLDFDTAQCKSSVTFEVWLDLKSPLYCKVSVECASEKVLRNGS